MTIYKRLVSIIISATVTISLLLSMSACGADENQKIIVVITKAGDSDFWQTIISGAYSAGTEYNAQVRLRYPDSDHDYYTQNKLLLSAISEGADAVVFSAIDFKKSSDAVNQVVDSGIPVIMMDSNVNSSKTSAFVGTDNFEAGKIAAKSILDSMDEEIKIGIINFDVNSANGQDRQNGFCSEILSDAGASIVAVMNVNSDAEAARVAAINMLEDHSDINAIMTFDEFTTLGAGQAIDELGLKDSIYCIGFDTNEKCVEMLDSGVIDALVVQNPFAIGYLSVKSAYQTASGIKPVRTLDTRTTLITRENMFDSSSQKVLFHFN